MPDTPTPPKQLRTIAEYPENNILGDSHPDYNFDQVRPLVDDLRVTALFLLDNPDRLHRYGNTLDSFSGDLESLIRAYERSERFWGGGGKTDGEHSACMSDIQSAYDRLAPVVQDTRLSRLEQNKAKALPDTETRKSAISKKRKWCELFRKDKSKLEREASKHGRYALVWLMFQLGLLLVGAWYVAVHLIGWSNELVKDNADISSSIYIHSALIRLAPASLLSPAWIISSRWRNLNKERQSKFMDQHIDLEVYPQLADAVNKYGHVNASSVVTALEDPAFAQTGKAQIPLAGN